MKKISRQQALNIPAIARIFKRIKLKPLLAIACSIFVAGFTILSAVQGTAQTTSLPAACVRPLAGSVVVNPPEILDPDAKHPANFTVLNVSPGEDCYLANGNLGAPTIRVTPGKKDLVLSLTNKLSGQAPVKIPQCVGGIIRGMPPQNSTNVHYHGLNVSPACGQDEVVSTIIQPNETFNFAIQIPKEEPPGMYWYHPHVHMQSQDQVISGLTGAIIIEGIKKFNKQAAKIPERVFVLRDLNPLKEQPATDLDQPATDISINYVPIRYQGKGTYDPPAVVQMNPNEQQFWRVANTAANTYFDLQVNYDGTPQQLGLVAMDGVPINADSKAKDQTLPVTHIFLPPASRAEFIVTAPGTGVKNAQLRTLKVDRGAAGDNDTQRTIARIETQSQLRSSAETDTSDKESNVNEDQVVGDRFAGISQTSPAAQRQIYFSQTPEDAIEEEFYITVEGDKPKPYQDFTKPAISVQEGTTEDWIVENRAPEAHAFHIHQIHFLVLESPDPSRVGMIMDTINVPAWNGDSKTPYPKVKLRMDFRGAKKDTSIAGTFLYHCHILEHEDGGMMAPIEVIASSSSKK